MAKHVGLYRSEKRKKELLRQKKQEEKRQKRLTKDAERGHSSDVTEEGVQNAEKENASAPPEDSGQ